MAPGWRSCSTGRRSSPAAAGSGESEIRRWIIENDWLEAIVGLPDQLFYNTGIATYVWIVTNRKPKHRKGQDPTHRRHERAVLREDAEEPRQQAERDRRWADGKADQMAEITRIYGDFKDGEFSKIFDNEDFGYWRITVERPLRLNFAVAPERIERLQATTSFPEDCQPAQEEG